MQESPRNTTRASGPRDSTSSEEAEMAEGCRPRAMMSPSKVRVAFPATYTRRLRKSTSRRPALCRGSRRGLGGG